MAKGNGAGAGLESKGGNHVQIQEPKKLRLLHDGDSEILGFWLVNRSLKQKYESVNTGGTGELMSADPELVGNAYSASRGTRVRTALKAGLAGPEPLQNLSQSRRSRHLNTSTNVIIQFNMNIRPAQKSERQQTAKTPSSFLAAQF